MDTTELVYAICNAIGGVSEEKMEEIRKIVISHTTNWEIVDYCGFTNVEDLIKDHMSLKKQIKEWELQCDVWIDYKDSVCISKFRGDIEAMAHEMMSINI